jgi:hypothetical protein
MKMFVARFARTSIPSISKKHLMEILKVRAIALTLVDEGRDYSVTK